MLAFRVKSPADEVAEPPDVSAVDEACFRIEALRNVLVHGVEFQVARTALGVDVVGRARQVRAVAELGFAGDRLAFNRQFWLILICVSTPPTRLNPTRSAKTCKGVGVGVQLAIGIDHADAVVLPQFAIHAQDAEVSVLSGKRVRPNHALPGERSLATMLPMAHGPALPVSRTPYRGSTDAPGENQLQRCLEEVGIFLEEGPLLREKDFKALVHRDLRVV